jgi:hypothetical protein
LKSGKLALRKQATKLIGLRKKKRTVLYVTRKFVTKERNATFAKKTVLYNIMNMYTAILSGFVKHIRRASATVTDMDYITGVMIYGVMHPRKIGTRVIFQAIYTRVDETHYFLMSELSVKNENHSFNIQQFIMALN